MHGFYYKHGLKSLCRYLLLLKYKYLLSLRSHLFKTITEIPKSTEMFTVGIVSYIKPLITLIHHLLALVTPYYKKPSSFKTTELIFFLI